MPKVLCRICGERLEIPKGKTICTCPHCRSALCLPRWEEGSPLEECHLHAEELRQGGDFDLAIAAYEELLPLASQEPEVYWGRLLSRYGVEYRENPATHQRIPFLHCLQATPIQEDADYLDALECAAEEQLALYQEEGERLALILGVALRLARQESAQDLCLCYRERDAQGTPTDSSRLAQELAGKLSPLAARLLLVPMSEGKKEEGLGEPALFAALSSARALVVLGSSREDLDCPCVRNVWGRFLRLAEDGTARLLLTCLHGGAPVDLPPRLAAHPRLDLSREEGEASLLSTLEQALRQPATPPQESAPRKKSPMEALREKARKARRKEARTELLALLKARLFSEAEEKARLLLQRQPRDSWPYLFLLMARLGAPTLESLHKSDAPLDREPEFQKALEVADPPLRAKLEALMQKQDEARHSALLQKDALAELQLRQEQLKVVTMPSQAMELLKKSASLPNTLPGTRTLRKSIVRKWEGFYGDQTQLIPLRTLPALMKILEQTGQPEAIFTGGRQTFLTLLLKFCGLPHDASPDALLARLRQVALDLDPQAAFTFQTLLFLARACAAQGQETLQRFLQEEFPQLEKNRPEMARQAFLEKIQALCHSLQDETLEGNALMSLLEQVQGLRSRSRHPLLQEEPTTATWVESLREAVFFQARLALQRKQLRPLRRIMELYPEEITSLKSHIADLEKRRTIRVFLSVLAPLGTSLMLLIAIHDCNIRQTRQQFSREGRQFLEQGDLEGLQGFLDRHGNAIPQEMRQEFLRQSKTGGALLRQMGFLCRQDRLEEARDLCRMAGEQNAWSPQERDQALDLLVPPIIRQAREALREGDLAKCRYLLDSLDSLELSESLAYAQAQTRLLLDDAVLALLRHKVESTPPETWEAAQAECDSLYTSPDAPQRAQGRALLGEACLQVARDALKQGDFPRSLLFHNQAMPLLPPEKQREEDTWREHAFLPRLASQARQALEQGDFAAFAQNAAYLEECAPDSPELPALEQAWKEHSRYLILDLVHGTSTCSPDAPAPEDLEDARTNKLWMRRIPAGADAQIPQDFYLAIFETTIAQHALLTGIPATTDAPGCPATNISYQSLFQKGHRKGTTANASPTEARGAIPAAQALFATPFRLPTPQEWEYACRAGTTTDLNIGVNLQDKEADRALAEVGRHKQSRRDQRDGRTSITTALVGSYRPNAWGLYDMHGNVRELCHTPLSSKGVFRGGSYALPPTQCVPSRVEEDLNVCKLTDAYPDAGYRLALTPGKWGLDHLPTGRKSPDAPISPTSP